MSEVRGWWEELRDKYGVPVDRTYVYIKGKNTSYNEETVKQLFVKAGYKEETYLGYSPTLATYPDRIGIEVHYNRNLHERNEIINQIEVLKKKLTLFEGFKDLTFKSDRWTKDYLSSKAVNILADDCDIKHSCGCCEDAALYAYPYTVINGVKIHTDPLYFYIGQRYQAGIGDEPAPGWEENLRQKELSQAVIDKVKEYFLRNTPERCSDYYDE